MKRSNTFQRDHRITQRLGLEGTWEVSQFQPRATRRDTLPLDQAAQGTGQTKLERCQGWGTHSISGKCVPVSQGPHGEKLPPNTSRNPADSRPDPFPFPPPPRPRRAGGAEPPSRSRPRARGSLPAPRLPPPPPSGGGGSEGVRKFKMAAAAEPEQRPPE